MFIFQWVYGKHGRGDSPTFLDYLVGVYTEDGRGTLTYSVVSKMSLLLLSKVNLWECRLGRKGFYIENLSSHD